MISEIEDTQNEIEEYKIQTIPALSEICSKFLGAYAEHIPDLSLIDEKYIDIICEHSNDFGLLHIETLIKSDYWQRNISLEKHWEALLEKINNNPKLKNKFHKHLKNYTEDYHKRMYWSILLFLIMYKNEQIDPKLIANHSNIYTHVIIQKLNLPANFIVIDNMNSLVYLSFSKSEIGIQLGKYLAEGIRKNKWPNLEKMKLKSNKLKNEGGIDLLKAIDESNEYIKIQWIDLRFNELDINVFTELIRYFGKYMEKAKLQYVNFSHNIYGPSLGEVFKQLKNLKSIFSKANCKMPVINHL